MTIFVGLDWGGSSHAVCVVDAAGKVLDHFVVAHDRDGLADLVARLRRHGPPGETPIAIERPSGLLVDALVDAGFVVTPVHPNVVKACRPRYRAVAAKSDPGDAYILADILRTDGHRLTPLKPQSDAIKALRALVRGRDDLVATRLVLANQLRALLESFWPGAAGLFADIASPIALAFLQRYPTPESASRLGEKRMAAFLAQNQYCGRRSVADVLGRLRAAPATMAAEAEADAKGELVRAIAVTLESLVAQIGKLSSRIEHAVAELPEGKIVMSFPRAGKICAAQITAELGDVRDRFQSQEHLAAEAGVAPVTYQSGKSRAVTWRWACNKRLRAALTCFADNSRHASPWAAKVYHDARERGCRHPHAVRILARAWLRILWRAWQDGTSYDPNKHPAASFLLTTG
ncbi:IS110 family transposase [Mesorhizobium sp. B2-1-8]|uniref:IS110 family transposase n=1 Tax=Mesorhizobium sp. B2-1-8 TaxID=2589967 RepID=UPI001128BAC6|nr:IS110 family transposase [Mesorhizobium sp. B2-1-8]UCI20393.1 IS110 family transposase [Mesorhizobium sp. B2-1-8]UCI22219.1 IS110 family transposase [Mesorhizobium sp. B2-1-8]